MLHSTSVATPPPPSVLPSEISPRPCPPWSKYSSPHHTASPGLSSDLLCLQTPQSTCHRTGPGTHTCTCLPGYVSVNDNCMDTVATVSGSKSKAPIFVHRSLSSFVFCGTEQELLMGRFLPLFLLCQIIQGNSNLLGVSSLLRVRDHFPFVRLLVGFRFYRSLYNAISGSRLSSHLINSRHLLFRDERIRVVINLICRMTSRGSPRGI